MKQTAYTTIFITGATDGIGRLTARRLATPKTRLLVHGRNPGKTAGLVTELQNISGHDQVEGFVADLSSLDDVRQLAGQVLDKHDELGVLINNAGAGYADPRYSRDGHELRFAVNYLAPFLLTTLLLPALRKGAPSRIVNVSSAGQSRINFEDIMGEKNFNPLSAYSQSKLALVMFTIDLAGVLVKDGVTVNCLHPGTYLDTNMVRASGIRPLGEPEEGAAAEAFLATDPKVEGISGKYFDGKKERRAHEEAYDPEVRNRLRMLSMRLTGLPDAGTAG